MYEPYPADHLGNSILGISIQDGTAEIILEKMNGTLTLSGAAGIRKITLPVSWRIVANEAVNRHGDIWTVKYAGGMQQTFKLVRAR